MQILSPVPILARRKQTRPNDGLGTRASGVQVPGPSRILRSWCLTASMTAFQADGSGSNPDGRSNIEVSKLINNISSFGDQHETMYRLWY